MPVFRTEKQETKRQVNELTILAESQVFGVPDDAVFSENISGFKKGADRPISSKGDYRDAIPYFEKAATILTQIPGSAENLIRLQRNHENCMKGGVVE